MWYDFMEYKRSKGGYRMNEVKTTFRRMVFYYFLMAINIIPNARIIPDSFPTLNVSFIYLLIKKIIVLRKVSDMLLCNLIFF